MKQISLFCDGSSLGNPGAGGYCGILRYKGSEKIVCGGEAMTTNNRMELRAVIESLKVLKEPCAVEIISDSSYVVRGINEWLQSWLKRDFDKVKNPDLWQEYVRVSKIHQIRATWVRGHNGHAENERCDSLAKSEAQKYKKSQQKE